MSSRESNQSFIKRYDTVFAFLSFELIALALFGIGGITGLAILQIAAAFVAVLIIPFIQNNLPGDWKKKALLALIPLGVFLLFTSFGAFWSKAYYGGNVLTVILYGLLTLLGGLGFFIVGYGLTQNPAGKMKYLVIAIVAGLGLYVLITGLYSLFRYGPFYVARFSGMVYYYDGVMFPVDRETKALIGFEFVEVALSYGKMAATLLACTGVGLIPLFKKTDKKLFFIILAGAAIGLLDLILTPYKFGLILTLIVYVVLGGAYLLFYLSKKGEKQKAIIHKATNIAFFVLIGIVVLGVLALFLDAMTGFIRNMNIPRISASLASDSSFLGSIRCSIEACLYGGSAGVSKKFSLVSFLFGASNAGVINCSVFEFDVLWQSGFLAFAGLVTMMFLGIRQARAFLLEGGEEEGHRLLVLGVLLAGVLYLSLKNNEAPQVYSSVFMPMSRNAMSFALIFLLGVTYAQPKKEVAA